MHSHAFFIVSDSYRVGGVGGSGDVGHVAIIIQIIVNMATDVLAHLGRISPITIASILSVIDN